MLLVLRDSQDRLEAAVDYYLVNADGTLNPMGVFIYVHQAEFNPTNKGIRLIRKIREKLAFYHPNAIMAYWERRDKTYSKIRGYRRDQLVRLEEVTV